MSHLIIYSFLSGEWVNGEDALDPHISQFWLSIKIKCSEPNLLEKFIPKREWLDALLTQVI